MSKPPDESKVDGFAATAPLTDEMTKSPAVAPVLAAGETVAGRYRVVRFLARGGMGEVFEVEDLQLHELVALKTIRETHGEGETRFKREIQLARTVTHLNVCRIFDVGYHERDGKRIVFLTMELLGGTTLSERIKAEGPLPTVEAFRIVKQIARALGAAHAAGVVHRDLKSANVMLVPRDRGVRVAVTDFGLAHGPIVEGQKGPTDPDMLIGTPGYMAPEQVEGKPVSGRTDLYALGIVMYEMVTGELPFTGGSPMSIATKRLHVPPPSPKKLRTDLPAKWERAILACLEKDPQRRPATAGAVLELLGVLPDSIEEIDGTVRIVKLRRRIPLVRPALALLTLVLVVLGLQVWRTSHHVATHAVLAALPLTPIGEGAAKEPSVGAVAAQLIRTRLSATHAVQLADDEATSSAELGGPAPPNDAQLERLRQLLGVDAFVTGRYRIDPDGELHVEAYLVDAATKRIRDTVRSDGPRVELSRVLVHLADEVGRVAGVLPEELTTGIDISLPERAETLRSYGEATQLLDRDELTTALATARAATLAEPEYARGHLLYAEVAHEAGDQATAMTEAHRAMELATKLPRRERLFVEGIASAIGDHHLLALERLQLLHQEVPGDVELSIRLAREQTAAGHGGDAQTLVEALRSSTRSTVTRHRLDGIEADAALQTGDLERATLARRRAVTDAELMGAKVARARDRLRECELLERIGPLARARDACLDARTVAAQRGERRLRALASDELAWIDFSAGVLPDASRTFADLLPSAHDLGDEVLERIVLVHLGEVAWDAGDLAAARRWWQEAASLAARSGDDLSVATIQIRLASLLELEGDLAGALERSVSAETVLGARGALEDHLDAICRTADIERELGRSRDVEQQLAAIEVTRARATANLAPRACQILEAKVELGRGHSDKAVKRLREEISGLVASGRKLEEARVRLSLALALEDAGDGTGALEQLALLDKLALPADPFVTRTINLARLRRGPQVRQPRILSGIAAAIARDSVPLVRADGEMDVARTRAALGEIELAVQKLLELADQAKKAGWLRLGLEAELHALTVSRKRPSASVTTDYATRARSAGFPGWAERAEQLLSSQ